MTSFNQTQTQTQTKAHYKKINNTEAWREVHRNLSIAIIAAKDAVIKEKTKRRFLLLEINSNVQEDGSPSEDFLKGMERRRGEYAILASKKAAAKHHYSSVRSVPAASKVHSKQERRNSLTIPSSTSTAETTKATYPKPLPIVEEASVHSLIDSSIPVATTAATASKEAEALTQMLSQYHDLASFLPSDKKQRLNGDTAPPIPTTTNQPPPSSFDANTNSAVERVPTQQQQSQMPLHYDTFDLRQQLLRQQQQLSQQVQVEQQQTHTTNAFPQQQTTAAWNNGIQDLMGQLQQQQQQQSHPFGSIQSNTMNEATMRQSLLQQQQNGTPTISNEAVAFLQQQQAALNQQQQAALNQQQQAALNQQQQVALAQQQMHLFQQQQRHQSIMNQAMLDGGLYDGGGGDDLNKSS